MRSRVAVVVLLAFCGKSAARRCGGLHPAGVGQRPRDGRRPAARDRYRPRRTTRRSRRCASRAPRSCRSRPNSRGARGTLPCV